MARRIQRHVEVYVFRRRAGGIQFLCLRRAAHRNLAGVWQPVTGKRRLGERAAAAALREVREETGVEPNRMWALERPSIYFDAATDQLHLLPLFAAEIGASERITLSDEHDAFRFLSGTRAGARYLWDGQRLGVKAVLRQIVRSPALARALEITRPSAKRRPRRSKSAGAGSRAGRRR